jgi:glycosyl transferase family 2
VSNAAAAVVIPTFQRRSEVRRAVDSALAQSISEIELIVVDDGSSDGTHEALSGLDPRLICLRQENRGAAAARNAAIERARAPVVAFLDADNRWSPGHLQALLDMLDRHPEAVLASTCPRFVDASDPSADEQCGDVLPEVLLGAVAGFLSCVAVRTAELVAVGGFHEEMTVGEDTDLWCQLALMGAFCVAPLGTVERGVGPDSLKARGQREGLYPAAWRLSAERFRANVQRSRHPRADELAAAGEAMELWARACEALVAGEAEAARQPVSQALRLFPTLSERPRAVVSRLPWAHPRWDDPSERERTIEALQEVWPAGAEALRLKIGAASASAS